MATKRIIAQLEKRMKAVVVERDRLRDLEDEVGALRETCSEALEDSVIYNAAYEFCENLGFMLDLNVPSHRNALIKFADEIKKGIIYLTPVRE